jgi:hypothetical protein
MNENKETTVKALIHYYGLGEYQKLVFERFDKPPFFSITETGIVAIDHGKLGEYIDARESEGMDIYQIIERDMDFYYEAVSDLYEHTFKNDRRAMIEIIGKLLES